MMHRQQRQSSTASPSLRCSSAASRSSSYPILRSVLAWSMTVLLISSCLGISNAKVLKGHSLHKRSFIHQCKGVWDISIFTRLNRICDDCYNLYQSAELYTLCMENCFTSHYFKGCVDALMMDDEIPQIKRWIMKLHGADIDI